MNTQRSVRLKDVAKHAGVGVGTASRVLNNEKSVNDELRRRVLNSMRELGYQPNAIARSLKSRQTKTIGIILPDISNGYYSEIVRGAEDVAHENDYSIILCNSDNRGRKEEKIITNLEEKQLDGYVIMSHKISQRTLNIIKKLKKPTVSISTYMPYKQVSTINISNFNAAKTAVDFLLENGHTKIAIITGPQEDRDSGLCRLGGYKQALIDHGIEINENIIANAYAYNYDEGFRCARELVDKIKQFTAVFASSDHLAIGAMKAFWLESIKIPEDISIIGFDNINVSEYTLPPLTTIHQPRYEMGRAAIEQLCCLINDSDAVAENITLKHSLVERETVKKLNYNY